jgi:putative salt-induced outer membrane protein YdiY
MLRDKFSIGFGCVILAFLAIPMCAQAETVVLVSGDNMNGEITKATDSSVVFVHSIFGETEIPKNQIASITIVHNVLGKIAVCPDQSAPSIAGMEAVEAVVLAGGDAIHGEITVKTDSAIVLVHPALGRLEIAKDRIVSITVIHGILGRVTTCEDWDKSADAGKPSVPAPVEKIPVKKEPKPKEEKKKAWYDPEFGKLNTAASKLKKKKWKISFDVSWNSTSGNTEEKTARLGSHIKRELPRERIAIDASYYRKESDGEETDNKFTLGAVHDWLNPGSRWFFFATGRFDYDAFESWEERGSVHIGPGYNLIKTDDVQLDWRFGAGGRKEFGSRNNDLKLEGLAGLDFKWKLSEKQSFDASYWYLPVLTDTSDRRTRATVNWRYRLAKELNLSLVAGLLYEDQSITDPGDDDTDTRTFLGIQVEF